MARNFIFSDEAGDFTFAKGNNISRYFIVCTVTMASCEVGSDILALRRELVWKKQPVRDFFHAAEDKQSIRDAVFEAIKTHKFKVQATVMEKKAMPRVRTTKHRFYQYGWLYHFKHSLSPHLKDDEEYLITAASVGTRKGQAVFTNAVNDVVQQHAKIGEPIFGQAQMTPAYKLRTIAPGLSNGSGNAVTSNRMISSKIEFLTNSTSGVMAERITTDSGAAWPAIPTILQRKRPGALIIG
jgi:hypothetical protein